jgi:hypothetical protein
MKRKIEASGDALEDDFYVAGSDSENGAPVIEDAAAVEPVKKTKKQKPASDATAAPATQARPSLFVIS